MFTGARQGSTWFIDSLERCKYSRNASEDAPYVDDVFKRTEVWKHFGEAQHDSGYMDADSVLQYIRANGSVKVFPSAFWRRRKEIEEVVRRRAEENIGLAVLRRDTGKTWRSLKTAEEKGVWNGNGEQRDWAQEGDEWEYFEGSRQRYEEGVRVLLEKVGVSVDNDVDVLDFDDVKHSEWILLQKAGCVVRNCNYERRGKER